MPGCHIVAVAETLAIAAGLGLSPRLVRDIVFTGPACTWMMGQRGQNMLDKLIEPPTFTIDIFVKDMSIVTREAGTVGVPVPLASLVEQVFVQGKMRGWGRHDDSSYVIEPSGTLTSRIVRCYGENLMPGPEL